ncbi:MAG: Arc family DNA-binding protein [Actinobacteria bacterium]|nr:Arc family DNA-binding protein [Actinomycetota bacterium]
MATLTIRNVDDGLRDKLRVRAAEHGRSMEAEVRAILNAALAARSDPRGLGTRIHDRFSSLDLEGLDLPERTEQPRIPDLES